jgi:hypothetical protein
MTTFIVTAFVGIVILFLVLIHRHGNEMKAIDDEMEKLAAEYEKRFGGK